MTLPEFSVRQTVFVNVLFFVCMIGGWNALQLTEVEYFHDVVLNQVVVSTAWTGASADEVERLVTAKLEDELITIGDVEEMRSSSQSNLSMINVDLDENLGTLDYESAVNDVRGALDQVDELPLDAEEPSLREIISEQREVVYIVVHDVGDVGPLPLRDVAREIESRTRELPGVSSVEIRGFQEREVRVLVDRARATLFGLTVDRIAERIRAQNQNLPAGTLQDARGEATVRATGDYRSTEEILDTVVLEEEDGTLVRVRDVASVERGLEKATFVTRYLGRPAVVIGLGKKDETDIRHLIARVDAFLEDFAPLVPEGIAVGTTVDSSDFVTPRITVLLENLAAGMFLVAALLWFTIGFRNAMLTIVAIPFAFLTAIIFFPLLDISINSNTLIGMLLVSGMLVDDAIIVLENIYRKIEEGLPVKEAVIRGSNEVLWPVATAVTTTVAAFAPLLLVGGTAGKFVSVLPKCVVVCLVASLFECLVILPAHYLDFGSRQSARAKAEAARTRPRPSGPLAVAQGFFQALRIGMERFFDTLRARYLTVLRPVITHRFSFLVLFVAFLMLTAAASTRLRFDLFPGEFATYSVSLESPPDFSLEQTSAVTEDLEAILFDLPPEDVLDFNTIVGLSVDLNYDRIIAPNLALTTVAIPQTERNQLRPQDVLDRATARLEAYAEAHPESVVSLRVESERYGPPVGRPVEVRVQSEDFSVNKKIAEELKVYLATIPGVFAVDDNLKEGPREIRLEIDDERASQFGLTFEDLARALRAANDGVVTSSFRSPSAVEDDDIRVLLEPGQRDRMLDLLEVEVRGRDGRLVRLGDVATLDVTRGYLSYRRVDGKRSVTVFASVDDELATSISVNRDLEARFADIQARFPEVELVYGGEYQESNESIRETLAAFPVALLAIYMLLATLFRSYSQPFIVLTSVPLGFAGIIFGVGLLDYSIDFNLLYAAVGLSGVVVNDALVLVDFINRARREGMDLLEAVAQSGAQRLRPVILTTMTTVVALLPMAFGLQGSSKSYGPFAAAIAFGLLFAMVGTLFVIPLSYASFANAEARLKRALQRVRGPGTAARAGGPGVGP